MLYIFNIFCQYIFLFFNKSCITLGGISPNVSAVYEVGGGIKGLCEASYQRYATAAANLPE